MLPTLNVILFGPTKLSGFVVSLLSILLSF